MVGLYVVFDVTHIIQSGGLLLVAAIIFAETGLLVGFFLPGDTLLFTAGFFVSQGDLPLAWLLLVTTIAAIAGNEAGYEIGNRTGKRIFSKKDGIIFREEYVEKASEFYDKHGGKTVVLARFVPIVRTFSAVVAGVSNMPRMKFFVYNVIGAVLWCFSIVGLGYWLGNRVPNIDKYILPVVVLAMFITFAPTVYHIFKDEKTRSMLWRRLKGKR